MLDKAELRLKCLELALVQAKNENSHQDINRVAEIHTRFYNLCIEGQATLPIPETEPAPTPGPRKTKADKAPEIFK